MYLLTLKTRREDGAYAVQDRHGDKVLFLFEEEDDEKYKKQMDVIEVDDELAIKTCKMYNYKYTVITPNDFVIPPKNDNLSKD